MIPGLFLLQPTVTASVAMTVHSVDDFDKAFGAASLLLLACHLAAVARCVLYRFKCVRIVIDPYPAQPGGRIKQFLRSVVVLLFHETSEWFDPSTGQYVDATAEVIEPYKQDRHWFVLVELMMCAVFGFLGGLMPTDRGICDSLIWVCTGLALLYMVLLVVLRPHIVPFDAWTAYIGGLSTLLACLMSVMHNEEGSIVADEVAVGSAVATLVVSVACAVFHPPVAAKRYAKTTGLRRHLLRQRVKSASEGQSLVISGATEGQIGIQALPGEVRIQTDDDAPSDRVFTEITSDRPGGASSSSEADDTRSSQVADDLRKQHVLAAMQLTLLLETARRTALHGGANTLEERRAKLGMLLRCICLKTGTRHDERFSLLS